jgi:hypothetical protein
MNESAVCRPTASVVSSDHRDGMVLMDLSSGQLFSANHTGQRIWRELEAQQSVEAIAAALSRDHQISFEDARAHTARFIAHLVSMKLVEMGS